MHWLERQWYRRGPWTVLLYPPSLLFWLLAALRRLFFRLGWLRAEHLPVPVIVVGNLTVGGSGKTPLVLWLADFLRHYGFHPGIISRGYGGSAAAPRPVAPDADAAQVGDEPLLLARRSGCPVWVGRDRPAAGCALLATHPECDLILSDDGLQHYRLRRDVEIAVVDGVRGFGNGLLLPAGPLRETAARLHSVDAVVVNGGGEAGPGVRSFEMRLRGTLLRNMVSGEVVEAEKFAGRTLDAVAAIGDPQRFFGHLRGLGLSVAAHPFPDHHAFVAQDFEGMDAEALVMTEKDAVKCAAFASLRFWVLAVDAEVEPALGMLIVEKLRGKH